MIVWYGQWFRIAGYSGNSYYESAATSWRCRDGDPTMSVVGTPTATNDDTHVRRVSENRTRTLDTRGLGVIRNGKNEKGNGTTAYETCHKKKTATTHKVGYSIVAATVTRAKKRRH